MQTAVSFTNEQRFWSSGSLFKVTQKTRVEVRLLAIMWELIKIL